MSEIKMITDSALVDEIKEFLSIHDKSKYVDKIDKLTGSSFSFMFYDVFDYDQNTKQEQIKLLPILMNHPKYFVTCMKKAVKSIHQAKYGAKTNSLDLNLILDDCENEISIIECIRHKHRNVLVKTKGLVNGESDIQTRLIESIWECADGHITKGQGDFKPKKCESPNCTNRDLVINEEKSKTESYRRFYVMGNFHSGREDILIVEGKDRFITSINLTDSVVLVGYISFEKRRDKIYNVFNLLNAKKLKEVSYEITEEDKQTFESWSNQDGHFNKLIASVAPRIFENRLAKLAFMLCYTGSTKWAENQRHVIHALVVGDPGQAKTQIAEWGKKHLPHVEIASVGATAKGLYAGLKEQVDGQKTIEIGPMVRQSDKGLVCIDEFLQMEDVHSICKYPMDSLVFPSDTVGAHGDLPCATPIYATGNPYNKGQWNDNKTIQENLHKIDYALLSRFDIIVIVRGNKRTAEEQQKVARKILNYKQQDEDLYNEELVSKYLIYAKSLEPILTEEAQKQIVEVVGEIFREKIEQSLKDDNLDLGEITERLTGIVVRLSIAHSKLFLSKEVTVQDVINARAFLKEMYSQRGFKLGGGQTFIERIGGLIFALLEANNSKDFTDEELGQELITNYVEDNDEFHNEIGDNGFIRANNRRWRSIMEYAENSDFVEVISKKNPRRIKWKVKGQTRF